MNLTIGGVVILLEEKVGPVWNFDSDDLVDDLMAIENVKEVTGPLINGIVAVTVEVEDDRPLYWQINDAKKKIRAVWDKYAKGE